MGRIFDRLMVWLLFIIGVVLSASVFWFPYIVPDSNFDTAILKVQYNVVLVFAYIASACMFKAWSVLLKSNIP